jgi:glutamate N-acetyltransferase/amino-acid N-acetyltransferase
VDAVSVTAPRGFRAQGVSCGIKAGGVLDMALIVAQAPVAAAAVFTTNQAAAAPVTLSRAHIGSPAGIRAIVANSGCANAATGPPGEANALRMAREAGGAIGCPAEHILVASTGSIGSQLPIDAVVEGITLSAAGLEAGDDAATRAATAIMTTDWVPKEVTISSAGYRIGGMAKGSGMIRPDMATMLAFLTTDAEVSPGDLNTALKVAVDRSFHALNIDGCSSTNDTVAVLASGAARVRPPLDEFTAALSQACSRLSEMMAADAEGAARVVEIFIAGATSDATARSAGRVIADSALVRASFFGGDPNWGRLIAALGASAIRFDPADFEVAYQGIVVARHGAGVGFDESALVATMESGDLSISIRIGEGSGAARVLTTDLTPDYVHFNGDRS